MISNSEILKLSISERLSLLEKIWNSIPTEKLSITKSQKKELDVRLERMEKGETKFYSWAEVKQQLKNK